MHVFLTYRAQNTAYTHSLMEKSSLDVIHDGGLSEQPLSQILRSCGGSNKQVLLYNQNLKF